jgi:signal peptidase
MKKFLKFLLNIVIYFGIVAGIVYGLPKYLTKKLGTEYPIAAITSGSMWPTSAKEDLKVGDIVVWQNSGGFTIHRIEKLNTNTIVTKGDGNFTSDEPVKYTDVIGRTVYRNEKPIRIPYMGYISVWAGKIRARN